MQVPATPALLPFTSRIPEVQPPTPSTATCSVMTRKVSCVQRGNQRAYQPSWTLQSWEGVTTSSVSNPKNHVG